LIFSFLTVFAIVALGDKSGCSPFLKGSELLGALIYLLFKIIVFIARLYLNVDPGFAIPACSGSHEAVDAP
jgi:hypothetical protein